MTARMTHAEYLRRKKGLRKTVPVIRPVVKATPVKVACKIGAPTRMPPPKAHRMMMREKRNAEAREYQRAAARRRVTEP
jgi:hypothetical protein